MDPLADILTLVEPRSTVSSGLSAGEPWALHFPPHEGIKFNVVTRGACWLVMDSAADAVRLEAGDCFLLATGRPFRLASDLGLPASDAAALFARANPGGAVRASEGDSFHLGGVRFTLDPVHAHLLVGALPPVVHIGRQADKDALRWSLERLQAELRDPMPGGTLVVRHLAQMMLIQALRLYLADGAAGGGWLAALADRRLASAISSMHADPARRWTVADLAVRAGMSRTAFAVDFRAVTGQSPIDYLTRWRMALAGERLRHRGATSAAVAASLGYESESAFGSAFRRVTGSSIRQHRVGERLLSL